MKDFKFSHIVVLLLVLSPILLVAIPCALVYFSLHRLLSFVETLKGKRLKKKEKNVNDMFGNFAKIKIPSFDA